MTICALIPAYNEAEHIAAVVAGVRAHLDDVLVYDDGSADATARVAAEAGARVLRHELNQGKGATLADGLNWIAENGYDAALTLDADGQHLPEEIPLFREAMETADIVIGSRMSKRKGMPFVRWNTNRFMSWLVSRLARTSIPDTQSGYRLIKCASWKRLDVLSRNFDFESEMLIAAGRAGMSISHVPIATVYGTEVSKIDPVTDTVRFLRMVWRLR